MPEEIFRLVTGRLSLGEQSTLAQSCRLYAGRMFGTWLGRCRLREFTGLKVPHDGQEHDARAAQARLVACAKQFEDATGGSGPCPQRSAPDGRPQSAAPGRDEFPERDSGAPLWAWMRRVHRCLFEQYRCTSLAIDRPAAERLMSTHRGGLVAFLIRGGLLCDCADHPDCDCVRMMLGRLLLTTRAATQLLFAPDAASRGVDGAFSVPNPGHAWIHDQTWLQHRHNGRPLAYVHEGTETWSLDTYTTPLLCARPITSLVLALDVLLHLPHELQSLASWRALMLHQQSFVAGEMTPAAWLNLRWTDVTCCLRALRREGVFGDTVWRCLDRFRCAGRVMVAVDRVPEDGAVRAPWMAWELAEMLAPPTFTWEQLSVCSLPSSVAADECDCAHQVPPVCHGARETQCVCTRRCASTLRVKLTRRTRRTCSAGSSSACRRTARCRASRG